MNETVLTQAYDTLKLITYIELSHSSSVSFTCGMWKNRRQINHLYFQPRIALMKILISNTVFCIARKCRASKLTKKFVTTVRVCLIIEILSLMVFTFFFFEPKQQKLFSIYNKSINERKKITEIALFLYSEFKQGLLITFPPFKIMYFSNVS